MTNEAVLEADVKKQWIIAQYPRSQLMVSDKSLRLVIELPAELSRAVFNRIGHGSIIGDSGYVAVMPANAELYQEFLNSVNGLADHAGNCGGPPPPAAHSLSSMAKKKGEHGDYARKLYTRGFFLHEEVLEALGTDEEYHEWIQEQPSCITGECDYWADNLGNMNSNCEAAHVRRAGHSGTGYKGKYAQVPLRHEEHKLQHGVNGGEAACLNKYLPKQVGEWDENSASEWFWDQRCKKVTEWGKMRLKATINDGLPKEATGFESLSEIHPTIIRKWCVDNNVSTNFLPQPRE